MQVLRPQRVIKKLSERANQDWMIRWMILNCGRVRLPVMSPEQQKFWSFVAHGLGRPCKFYTDTTEKLHPYKFVAPITLGYSHGLESSVIRFANPHIPTFNIRRYVKWTNPVEGAVGIVGAGLGYAVTMVGAELDPHETFRGSMKEAGFWFELSLPYLRRWTQYSGACLLTPLSVFYKDEIFKVSIREKIPFNSCYEDGKNWCGKCEKCLLLDKMYRKHRLPSPVTV